MTLQEELINRIDEFNAKKIAAKAVADQALQKELFACFFDESPVLSSRAAWVVSHAFDMDHSVIRPYETKIINVLKKEGMHPGVIRNILRIYQVQPVPEKHSVFMLETCYSYLKSALQPPAIRAFAITVIFHISKKYPELLDELRIVLEGIVQYEQTPALKARSNNTLKEIRKLKK